MADDSIGWMITTRPATPADEAHLREIYNATVRDGDPEIRTRDASSRATGTKIRDEDPFEERSTDSLSPAADLSAWLERDDTRMIVAENHGTILGWGVVFLDETPLATIFVDPEAPRVETRDQLLSHVERIADDVGITQLSLLTY